MMVKVKLDHVYVSVKNMDREIKFYEDLIGKKITNREENTWADFDIGKGFYFGLINPKIIGKKRIVGNNSIPVFWTDKIDQLFETVKKHNIKIKFKPTTLTFTDYFYRCFQIYDTEGNLIEAAQYDRK